MALCCVFTITEGKKRNVKRNCSRTDEVILKFSRRIAYASGKKDSCQKGSGLGLNLLITEWG